ncbi:hypothetical protein GALMADRAFT_1188215 [Galerina marginata CBS 339.88]|uniref:Uncharacterized protein n=1 Tax=Galerina marginata (strain CBS 339.88) TaxID=685588 RepID=A0A067TD42_GALM3|nr:hypothetical protein GALMADRAFT_1188215 [Galerina marginata CBS 339.88]
MAQQKLTMSRRIGWGFTGILLLAGVTFYFAKRNISERRKAELDQYRACRSSSHFRVHTDVASQYNFTFCSSWCPQVLAALFLTLIRPLTQTNQ